MNTVVQLRTAQGDKPRSELIYGTPRRLVPGRLGPVAVFTPRALVAYRIRYHRRTRLFVFRTLDVDDRLAASVPGVRPHVQLLLEVRSEGRVRRMRRLFAYVLKAGRDPDGLPDAFYVRVGAVLAGRLPQHPIVASLLSSQLQPNDSPNR